MPRYSVYDSKGDIVGGEHSFIQNELVATAVSIDDIGALRFSIAEKEAADIDGEQIIAVAPGQWGYVTIIPAKREGEDSETTEKPVQ